MTAPFNKFALFVCLLFLAGCVGNKKTFIAVEPSAEKGSVVYVYRPSKITNVMQTPKLSIAGVKKFGISSGAYKQFYLLPGKYAVKLHAIKGNTEAVGHELLVIKGQVHYLRVDASMKFETGKSYQPYQRKFGLTGVSPELAKLEIAGCKNMGGNEKSKPATMSGAEAADEEEAGFSVDKTQNPFSH